MQPALAVPAVARTNLRRSVIVAGCFGVAAVVLLGLFGNLVMGLFICLGLALGAVNSRLVQRAVLRYGASGAVNKKAVFGRTVLSRLAVITVIAVGCAVLVRPSGIGVIIGLALFQMLMLGGASVPVFRSLRQP